MPAAAYILKVPPNRREVLLFHEGDGRYTADEPNIAEPVPRFNQSRRDALVVFACFADDAITHIADGRKGVNAGTGLVRLNMTSVESVEPPVSFNELLEVVPARVRPHVGRILDSGGILPPKSLGAVVDALIRLQPSLTSRLGRFSDQRAENIARFSQEVRQNLAVQKETLTAALQISGIGTEEVLKWSPPQEGPHRSFLEGLPNAYVREDAAITSDFADLPGFEAIANLPFAARVFQSTSGPVIRLKVVMANRLGIEEQTGADLIYYNEAFHSFVMVQYKMMERGSDKWEFRWQQDDQFMQEVQRMDNLLRELGLQPSDNSPTSFRLHANPFFLKLCPRIIFNPDDKGLFPGMYLPLDFWRSLAGDDATTGPRGGKVITYDNVQRKFNNTEFIQLVTDAWVGTTVPQSAVLARVIEGVIQTGRTVTLAVKSAPANTESSSAGGEDIVSPEDLADFFG